MTRQFDGAGFPFQSTGADAQAESLELPFVVFIDTVIAIELFRVVGIAANGMKQRARNDL